MVLLYFPDYSFGLFDFFCIFNDFGLANGCLRPPGLYENFFFVLYFQWFYYIFQTIALFFFDFFDISNDFGIFLDSMFVVVSYFYISMSVCLDYMHV